MTFKLITRVKCNFVENQFQIFLKLFKKKSNRNNFSGLYRFWVQSEPGRQQNNFFTRPFRNAPV